MCPNLRLEARGSLLDAKYVFQISTSRSPVSGVRFPFADFIETDC